MELTDAAARGHGVIERWCVLAEQRLEHLTGLFETGRWRRYYGEIAFLDNIQEAKLAVETWRGLLNREATPDNLPVDLSWLGRRQTTLPPRGSFLNKEPPAVASVISASTSKPLPAVQAAVAPAKPVPMSLVASIAPADPKLRDENLQHSSRDSLQDSWQHALSTDRLQQRYPLLRNAF